MAPTPRDPDCPRCPHTLHLFLACDFDDCTCLTSAWHGYPDPDTYPLKES